MKAKKGAIANQKLTSKGAMFGLDARIALAIFGALSVISGAALYSAIKQAKVVASVAELKEVAKAVESYYIDTGVLPINSGDDQIRLWELLENGNSVANWQGPYMSKEKGSHFSRFKGPVAIGNYEITSAVYESGDWGETDGNGPGGPIICDSGDKCAAWIGIASVNNKASADAIDKLIDGAIDNKKGSLRVYHTTPTYWIWMKVLDLQG